MLSKSGRAQGGGGGGFLGGSMDDTFANSLPGTPAESNYNDEAFDDTGSVSSTACSASMPAAEFKAVEFVRRVLDRAATRTGGGLPLAQLFAVISRSGDSAEAARNFIGWTQLELEEFLRKRPRLFNLNSTGPDAMVSNGSAFGRNEFQRRSLRLSSQSSSSTTADPPPPRSLSNRRGRVFHCAKLWGIIDLGRHEHVFFDRSIFKHVDDLQKYFKVNDTVYFNAILATKDSRAKWRATQVWRESDQALMERPASSAVPPSQQPRSSAATLLDLADDVKFLSDIDNQRDGWSVSSGGSSDPAEIGEFGADFDLEDNLADNVANLKLIGGQPSAYQPEVKQPDAASETASELCSQCASLVSVSTASVATQTMSTGEIMAMQIFHDL
ncbi:hypothetical protein BOX15_Mlig014738g1 [Macrostomum lignano]|uniref:Egal-1 winged helix domain-containing protein n=1 Tax=Macrostomum lignano TaxID=282301 RepID=A0A267F5A5_9PLAT|nr:hypothetical protein BOX15_Mlig014738g1 [Macrostomum lignano]